MIRTLSIALLVVSLHPPDVRASCAWTPTKSVKLVVDSCTPVDTSKLKRPADPKSYAGLLLEGALTSDGKTAPAKVWVPASEKLACAKLPAKTVVSGRLDLACCDGDPNPPCWIETSSILTKVVVAPGPKPVKKMTRAELEQEVEALRLENRRLHDEVDAASAREAERRRQLENQTQKIHGGKLK
jgi:hypothetical protein